MVRKKTERESEGLVAEIFNFKEVLKMRFYLTLFLFIISLLSTALAQVEEEKIHEYVFVTANRFEELLADVPFTVKIIDEKEILNGGFKSLEEVLRGVAGIEITQSGSKGHLSSAFLRGSNTNHTLILLDGVPLNEPSSYSFDLSKIPLQSVERIEILKGPQSAIWGTDAIGGVINIITKKRKGVSGELGYGSDRTVNSSIYGSAEISKFTLGSSISYFSTKGNFENDDFKSKEIALRGGRKFENGEISFFWQRISSEVGIPFNIGLPSLHRREKSNQDIFHIPLKGKIKSSELYAEVSFLEKKYDFSDPEDPWGYTRSSTRSKVGRLNISGKTPLFETNTLFWGFEGVISKVFDEGPWGVNLEWEKVNEKAFFVSDTWRPLKNIVFQGGIRAGWNSQYGRHLSPRIAGSILLPKNLRFRLSWGEGFRAPTTLEFAGPFGNKDLKPEKSKGWEAGIDQSLFDGKFLWNIVYFDNRYSDLISFDYSSFKMANLNSAKSRGAEFTISVIPFRNFSIESSYTYLKTEDQNGESLLRRPKNSFSARINWTPIDRLSIYIFHEIRGKRRDIDEISYQYVENPSFDRTNLNLRFKFNNHFSISLSVHNLLNKKIQEIYGYPSPDRSVLINLEMK